MRIPATLVALAHLSLAACQTNPGDLLLPQAGGDAPARPAASAKPYMRCVTDFWGNCTGVVSSRHAYRWRYVRPGSRPRELRESKTARANAKAQKAAERREKSQQTAERNEKRQKTESREKTASEETAPARASMVLGTKIENRDQDVRKNAPVRTIAVRDTTVACHPRRRVIGEERPSRDDARRAAEDGWMGAVRYDYGERYQDINLAKDVRQICGPSSVSLALKTPHYRCVVEATPCRTTKGTPVEPDERRYERDEEAQISRK